MNFHKTALNDLSLTLGTALTIVGPSIGCAHGKHGTQTDADKKAATATAQGKADETTGET